MIQSFPSRPAAGDESRSALARRPTARLSHHARLRCREMGLGTKAVKAAVAAPEMDLPARYGRRALVGGALAVIYDAAANEVITVLWAQGESREGGPVRRAAG